jgi:hypothetical protein
MVMMMDIMDRIEVRYSMVCSDLRLSPQRTHPRWFTHRAWQDHLEVGALCKKELA